MRFLEGAPQVLGTCTQDGDKAGGAFAEAHADVVRKQEGLHEEQEGVPTVYAQGGVGARAMATRTQTAPTRRIARKSSSRPSLFTLGACPSHNGSRAA